MVMGEVVTPRTEMIVCGLPSSLMVRSIFCSSISSFTLIVSGIVTGLPGVPEAMVSVSLPRGVWANAVTPSPQPKGIAKQSNGVVGASSLDLPRCVAGHYTGRLCKWLLAKALAGGHLLHKLRSRP